MLEVSQYWWVGTEVGPSCSIPGVEGQEFPPKGKEILFGPSSVMTISVTFTDMVRINNMGSILCIRSIGIRPSDLVSVPKPLSVQVSVVRPPLPPTVPYSDFSRPDFLQTSSFRPDRRVSCPRSQSVGPEYRVQTVHDRHTVKDILPYYYHGQRIPTGIPNLF